ncbi:hypothetical protein G7Z17_g6489 [Cylindrodendrum hubeiense]|uniref:Hydroxyneurosporene synthase n=1 Tax=Cylindrodendrum hubeiense TaxID=595255 RepID=A0A9P5H9S3_9HYPO|nr:hypothetical protein G7Z17_g6489 [Cylindrodendrum hubeiense]
MRATVPVLAALGGLASASWGVETYVIPTGQINGTTDADSRVGTSAFDGPHIEVNNGSAYQWWYFDAVSHESNAAVVAQFYPGWFPEASAVLLNIAWPNGTVYQSTIPVGNLQLTTVGDGSQGYVDDGAMTWFGSSDLSVYHLSLNLADVGVSGKITMRSRAPSHVACGLNLPGASFDFAPFLSWSNSVPDSHATVDLVVNGTSLSFEGSGYHDQNWGAANFARSLTQWYWGHSNVGNYSLVFFYHLDLSLKVTSSVYLAENGKPIISGCSVVEVAPLGPGTSVPLKRGTEVEGWSIKIDDPLRGKFAFTVENTVTTSTQNQVYTRWIGRTTGGRDGGTNSTGAGIIEWMNNPTL